MLSLPQLQPGEIYDQSSNSIISLSDSHICVTYTDSTSEKWPIPNSVNTNDKKFQRLPLKFIQGQNLNISISPSGSTVVCKADTIQQVQMNKQFYQGVAYWSLYISQPTLGFSVGIKDSSKKKTQVFDFSFKKSVVLTFKIDFNKSTFKCWLNGVQSETKPQINLQKGEKWTPFIRIKTNGSSALLNSLINDPQQFINPLNPFRTTSQIPQEPYSSESKSYQNCQFQPSKDEYKLQKINQDSLILYSEHNFRLIRRQKDSSKFDFRFNQFVDEKNIAIAFSEQEYNFLNFFAQKINKKLIGESFFKEDLKVHYVKKDKKSWKNWLEEGLNLIDQLIKQNHQGFTTEQFSSTFNFSLSTLFEIGKMYLTKFQSIRLWLNEDAIQTPYSGLDRQMSWGIQSIMFPKLNSAFQISKYYCLNNLPHLSFNSKIQRVKSDGKTTAVCQFSEGNRVCLVNIESICFKIIDINISKGFKKQNQINQYKKEAEDIQGNNFNQPHIYKILKNCLKYADKIKPPEKLLKQIQVKKSQETVIKKEKQKIKLVGQLQPDAALLDSLVAMGFNQKVSKKVLIQSKNVSLEAAIELILTKYQHQNVQTPTPSPTKLKNDWSCSICTFLNKKAASVCQICNSPAPKQAFIAQQTKVQLQKKQQNVWKKEEVVQEVDINVGSENIEQNIKNIFIWNTKINYCPILIGAVFETKIRFRLLGPNPKYYSIFYAKDQGFIDLSTLNSHQFAHLIQREPIQFLNYLTSTQAESKSNSFGWINIEDFDLDFKQEVNSMTFESDVFNKDAHNFLIKILSNDTQFSYKSKIVIQNVYEQKRKCLQINPDFTKNQNLKQQANLSNYLTKTCYTQLYGNELASNSEINAVFSNNKTDTTSVFSEIFKTINSVSCQNSSSNSMLPMIAVSGPYGFDISYPKIGVYSSSQKVFNKVNHSANGIVFSHIHNKKFIGSCIVIQKLKKGAVQNSGFVYLSNDTSKLPLVKYGFSFSEDSSKAVINIQDRKQYSFVVLVPNSKQPLEAFTLDSISVYGQAFENNSHTQNDNNRISVDFITNNSLSVKFENQQFNSKKLNQICKVQSWIENLPFDVSQVQNTVDLVQALVKHNYPLDIKIAIKLKTKEAISAKVKSIQLLGWIKLTQTVKFSSQQKCIISELQYKDYLNNYLKTGDVQLLDILQDQNNLEYRNTITSLQFKDFILSKVFTCPSDDKVKNQHQQFLKIFMPYIKTTLNVNQLFKDVATSEHITANGMELAFYLFRFSQPQNQVVFKSFFQTLETIQKRKNTLNLTNAKGMWESFYYQKNIFSDYCHKMLQKNDNLSNTSDLITTHFIVFREQFSRKYIIDMMSTYNLQNILLRFDQADQRSKLKLKISSISAKGQEVQIFRQFYDEHIWDQICRNQRANTGSNYLNINLKGTKSRYLVLQILFTNLPHVATKKQAENMPQNEIIPEIFGSYVGQSDAHLGKYFNFANESLTFIRKIDYMNKFSVKIQQKNASCYNSEYRFMLQQNNNLQQLQNKPDLASNKDVIMKLLMQKASRDNLNYFYTLATLTLNNLLDRSNLKNCTASVQQLSLILDVLVNHQKGIIVDRAISMLRKVMKCNSDIIFKLLRCKVNSQVNFISIFKEFDLFTNNELKSKVEGLTHVNELIQNKSLLLNLAWFIKITDNCPQNILQNLVKSSIALGEHEHIQFLFVKFGWISGIKQILNILNKNRKFKEQNIRMLVKSSKNVQQLCDYALVMLKDNEQEVFQIVLDQLSEKDRKVSAKNTKPIVSYLLHMVDSDKDNQLPQHFLTALNMTSTFGYEHQTAVQIVQKYFCLSQKQTYISQLFNSSILTDKAFYQTIIFQCVSIINKNKYKYSEDELSLVNQILIFILKKQSDIENQSVSLQIGKETETLIVNAFSNFIKARLNIGGIQSAKLIGEEVTQNISIGFFLSIFCRSHQIFLKISGQTLQNLIQWMFYNVRTNLLKNTKTFGGSRFIKVEQVVYKIIQNRSRGNVEQFCKVFMQCYKKMQNQLKNMKNQVLKALHQQKCYYFVSKIIEQLSKINHTLVKALLDQNNLFFSLLEHIISFDSKALNEFEQVQQKQLVNNFKLKDNKDPAPKDWLAYKNGAKNHVFRIEFGKSTQQVSHLTFQSDQQVTLSKIIFGFKYDYLPTQKNICLPKEIQVEGGVSLDKLKLIGKMTSIPDDFYINYSVKIFAYNSNLVKPGQTLVLSCNKNQPIKFLRFKIKSPDTISISDAINTDISVQANTVSLINFLSVQGYCQQFVSPQVDEVIRSLELLSKPKHKTLIQQLFKQETVVNNFKRSLLNISFLMKNQKYQKILHNFLMRICEQNSNIGNQMIDKYLQLQNAQLCSKISAQIVLSNDKEVSHRVSKYFSFINAVLQKKTESISLLLPFLRRFIQISFIVMNRKKIDESVEISPINLDFSQSAFDTLIGLEDQVDGITYRKFIKTVMTLDTPFTVKGFSHQKILSKLSSKQGSYGLQLIASLILSNKESRKWFMQNNCLQKYFSQTIQMIKNGEVSQKITQNLKFLYLLCYSQNLKKLINKYQFNLKIFQILMSKQYEKLLSNHQNKDLRDTFVDFIARSSLGSQNQKIISSLLKDSIPNIISQGNQKFVGQIFLPLLNSYQKIAISLTPYSSQQNKLITDITNIKNSIDTANKVKATPTISKFRLPSGLLSQNQKEKVFNLVRNANTYSAGNFNLVINHGVHSLNIAEKIQKKLLKSSQPFLILFRTKQTQNAQQVIGVFYNRSSKSKNVVDLAWQKGSFIFVLQTNKQTILIDKPAKQGQVLIHLENCSNQYSQDVTIEKQNFLDFRYNGQTFGRLSFTYSSSSFFIPSILTQKTKKFNMNQFSLDSAEYWLLDTTTLKVTEPQKVGQSFAQNIIKNNFSQNYFKDNLLSNKAIQTLRYENVYEFPSSIIVSQLKTSIQVMKCPLIENKTKQLSLKVMIDKKAPVLQQTSSLQVLKKISIEKDEPVIDLTVQFDNVLSLLNFSRANNIESVEFLPRKGILKFFEQNDGIQAMIKVIKKSIQSWSNKSRMQKWLQYITELQKFSLFPHFFAMYLKDKQTFALLFNLLAGLPDKQLDAKWDTLQSTSSQKLLKIVSQILHVDKSSNFRQYAMKNDFFSTILQRLRILTGQFKRQFESSVEQQEQVNNSPSKNDAEDDGIKKVKKKKGVGYGNDSSSNTKWMKGQHLDNEKKEFAVIQIILNIIENFLDIKHWKIPDILLRNVYESALLPFIEDGLRAGTLLEISKHPPKFKAIFKIIRVFSKHQRFIPILLPLQINYQPKQIESLQSLMKSLSNTASIFLSCLQINKNTQSKQQQVSEELAKDIIQTYKTIEEGIEDYRQTHNQQDNQKQMDGILELPLDKKYRLLMKNLRFDYIDMKENSKIKHHYASSFTPNYTPNQTKMIRLAQELADISTALPFQHTNGVYVRCDKDRVDFMQAMIMGSNGTPYGHGAFLFDVYFDDNYPNGPPKVNLTTTGHGKIRFNPNLYACGKVCLSLLGTWRGSASQNWDAKVSTLLQVLLSIQAIIMSEQVYFNEPGFENQQGTVQGEKKNEAYSNIVRYGNVKFAMVDNLKNPPKGFEAIVRRHFYLKQHQIMQQCNKWLKYAQKREANYVGLVNDHNHSWSTQFKKSKTTYKQMLQKAVEQLKQEFAKLPAPKLSDISSAKTVKKAKKQKILTNKLEQLQKQHQEQIDVTYEKKTQQTQNNMGMDINDEKVKDRWSRYIGAMGIDAVSKQSKADILVFGLNPFALQVIKNLVLSGCRKLSICDQSQIKIQDLSGGFFYSQEDVGKKRESILYKIKELNIYVKIQTVKYDIIDSAFIKPYSIVLATELSLEEQIKISKMCKQNKVKFISADCQGFACRIVNDLGEQFEVLDKNGEEPVEVFIKQISSAENGIITLLDGVKNPFEDGQAVLIRNVQGMKLKQDQKKSINDTIHKVKVINSKSFQIGNTSVYDPYVRNGTAKNIKTPVNLKYQNFQNVVTDLQKIYSDQNLQFFDFAKLQNSKVVKSAYLILNQFKKVQKRNVLPWDVNDLGKFVQMFKKMFKGQLNPKIQAFIRKFALTCGGNLPPLCAFFGGMVSQQIIKSITQKFKPISSEFYLQFSEVVPQLPEQLQKWNQEVFDKIYSKKQTRDKGFEIVVGCQLIKIIQNSKLFMIGAGAIGCQLLKNFAMISLGTGQQGKITLTDPDHIQNSNLNRQFLFREKHISKSKSRTAAASILLMNPYLKNHISPLTQRISDSTKDIFTNKFFASLTLVTNALDNVAARRYVDQRCVQNKIPLFQSGTLGPKGHVQVIIPYLTESYGSQNDPIQQGQIPHCTLKMFPEETLHCIEWARDIFGKKFSLQPKALLKTLDKIYKPQKDDIKSLTECLTMVKKGPKTFSDCITYAVTKFYKYYRDDIMQLLYTYPLDAKTKNGQPFWKLPKRPPTPLKQFDPQNLMHCTFVSTLAVLVAKIYQIAYPKTFRTDKERYAIGKQASKKKVPQFVPSDEKAKQILKESSTQKKQGEEQQQTEKVIQQKDQNQLYKQIISTGTQDFKIKSQEFEKDDDANGHIDFIYAMANLRAINYKLDQMDWITVKLKAGRIVPALATTTSCVAGLQTLQLCKYLKKTKIDLMRNSYLNLAVPSIQMSEPGQVLKKKLTQKLTVNLWDRWEVECSQKTTFGELYKKLQQKYEIRPIGVLQGMSRIDTGKGQQQRQAFLSQVIVDKLQKQDDCIDIIVLFTKLQEEQKILEGVPPVRLIFKN